MVKELKTSFSLAITKSLLEKIRGIVDTMPGESVNVYIEEILKREIDKHEDEYGEVGPVQDLYFSAPRRTKRTKL